MPDPKRGVKIAGHTVDGRNPAISSSKGSLSHYLQGYLHPRRCRISSINSIKGNQWLINP